MSLVNKNISQIKSSQLILTFLSICLFYFFESAQIAYYNVLAPSLLHGAYNSHQVGAISAAYFYGDMVGLIPVGYALDKFSLRKSLIWAILGSLVGAFLLFTLSSFSGQWIARFICGFFGGTFSFLGGIRIISLFFKNKFTYFMSLFLAAGMLGGMLCQYPLLLLIHHYGPKSGMEAIFYFGLFVIAVNFFYLKPPEHHEHSHEQSTRNAYSLFQVLKIIGLNLRNWCDVIMVICLDSPIIILGTLWGIVFLTSFYGFSPATSSWLIMSMFLGLLVGLPVWGKVADHYNHKPWIIILGALICFCMTVLMFIFSKLGSPILISVLLFGLGFFSSCQSMGFSWLIQGMKPELVGRNSAFNSIVMMASNGGIKQLGAFLIAAPSVTTKISSSSNLLVLISIAMLISGIYAILRKFLFSS